MDITLLFNDLSEGNIDWFWEVPSIVKIDSNHPGLDHIRFVYIGGPVDGLYEVDFVEKEDVAYLHLGKRLR